MARYQRAVGNAAADDDNPDQRGLARMLSAKRTAWQKDDDSYAAAFV
jgi:hypothetical protein